MMPVFQLTPAAAGRIYDGPHFHRSRSLEENRRIIRDSIRALKASPSMAMRYFGCVLEAIQKLPKTLAPQKA
jgi:hypothetical protein